MVQISGDGINWKNWKASTLNFDGKFMTNGICVPLVMPNGFDNGLQIKCGQAGHAYKTFWATQTKVFSA